MRGVANQENLASGPFRERIANGERPDGDFGGFSSFVIND